MQKCIIMTDMPGDVIDFPELITHIQYVQTLPAPTVAMYMAVEAVVDTA